MRTIDLLSKTIIEPQSLNAGIQAIAKKLSFVYLEDSFTNIDLFSVHLYNNDHKNILEIRLNKSNFKATFNTFDVRGCGAIAAVDWNEEEDMLIPFLTELFKKYPEMIVYNEEAVPQNRNSAAYYKSDIDNFKGELPYMLFDKLPAKRF